eukprot:SAG31_NODE_206_length_20335_cov_17.910160_7_plen_84_part_00
MVPYVLRCLKSREDKMIELAIKVVSLLVPKSKQLPSLAQAKIARQIAKRVLTVMGESGSSTDLTQVCYRCVAVILRDLPAAEV